MSTSEIIKQIAGKILANIKSNYPNHYTDTNKNKILIKTILTKIEKYSHNINSNNINNIINNINQEIINEFHSNQDSSKMYQVQLERNNIISNGRPLNISHRPSSSQNNFYDSNSNNNNESIPLDKRYEDMIKNRQTNSFVRQRPSTPDFSGERNKQPKQQKQQIKDVKKIVNESENINFTHNPQTNFGIIGINELPHNNSSFSSFDNVDDGFSNINIMNTGVNMNDIKVDENITVDSRLKQLEYDRNSLFDNNSKKNIEYFTNSKTQDEPIIQDKIQFINQEKKNINEDNRYQEKNINEEKFKQKNNQILNQENREQNSILEKLVNQQNIFYNEIINLKNIVSSNTNNNEIEQYKDINSKLQSRIIELQKQLQLNGNNGDNPKINELANIKKDTLNQIDKLKIIQDDIIYKIEMFNKLEEYIKKNIYIFENGELNILINSSVIILPEIINNVTSIEFKNFNLPFNKFNITDNNNKLHFIIKNEDLLKDENIIKDNILNIEGNEIELVIRMGNYSIDNICDIINNVLKNYDINITYCKNTEIVTFQSKYNFEILYNNNSLLSNLGFFKKNYINNNIYISEKIYNLESSKLYNIYLTNINDNKHILQYIVDNNSNDNLKKIIFTPVITELKELHLKFYDINNKEFKFNEDNNFTFYINVKIKYIGINKFNNKLNNELTNENILDIVNNSINI